MQKWGPQTKSDSGSLVQHGFFEALYTRQKCPAKKSIFSMMSRTIIMFLVMYPNFLNKPLFWGLPTDQYS